MNRMASRSYSRPGLSLARWAWVNSTSSSSSLPTMASPHGHVRCVFTLLPFPSGDLLLRRLGCCFHLLLVRTHFAHRLGVDDIGDGDVRAVLAELPGRRAPAFRRHPVLLAQQRQKDLGLDLAETGQPLDSPQQLLAVGVARGPQAGGIAVVTVHDDLGQGLDTFGHRSRKSVYRRPFRAQRGELVGVVLGNFMSTEAAHPVRDLLRSCEGRLERYLLIQNHPDE